MKIVFMKFGTKRQLFLNFDVMLLTPVYYLKRGIAPTGVIYMHTR